jgi:hypothetical protein
VEADEDGDGMMYQVCVRVCVCVCVCVRQHTCTRSFICAGDVWLPRMYRARVFMHAWCR